MQTHLVFESSWRFAISNMQSPSSFSICLSGPVISAEMSSTYTVITTIGWTIKVASTRLMSIILISVVAIPEPAVMPLMAITSIETIVPMRITRVSLYVAIESLSSFRG